MKIERYRKWLGENHSNRFSARVMASILQAAVLLAAFVLSAATLTAQQEAVFRRSVVAADHVAASEAGASMLRQGGNAVDAAVATSFALAVVRPASCGIGGGGFMLIWNAEKQTAVALDYRERAPAAATRDMYLAAATHIDEGTAVAESKAEPGSVRGALAAGIPGTVAGLCHAAETYGSLPLEKLLEPAIRLCREGVEIDAHDMDVQHSALQTLRKYPGYESRFALLLSQYLNHGKRWKKGDRFFSPLLPALELIAAHGAAGFYTGEVAAAIQELMHADGGIITALDLQSRVPAVREVLQAKFHGDTVLTMPPPSSGGLALIQTLQSLEQWEQLSDSSLKNLKHNSSDYVHVVSEALKHAFADRAEFLGDTDFVDVPVKRMVSDSYARQIAARIDRSRTLSAESYGRFFAGSDGGTSHFSVIDSVGNAVACTETVNLTFGSFSVVPRYGIVLNNQMDDFSALPGEPNAFGLMQSEANAVQPGKKPLSSMTPTIVVRDGKAVFSCGASGRPRIITATLQVLLNFELFEMTPQQAVTAARFHHQWYPNELLLERALAKELTEPLSSLGHQIRSSSSLAASQAVANTADGLKGGSDPRKYGTPAGE